MDEHIYPQREPVPCQNWPPTRSQRQALDALQVIENQSPRPRRRAVEPVPARGQAEARATEGLTNAEYAPWLRSWAACFGPASVQLFGARHRQHGNHCPLRLEPHQGQAWLEPLLEGEFRRPLP